MVGNNTCRRVTHASKNTFFIFGISHISTATCSQNLSAETQTKPQIQLLAKGVIAFALLVTLAFGIVITLMAKAAVKWWLNL